ncbi:MAG: plastocyanin/azurin family copper-binding protein [Actinomycetota bacterium]
MAALATRRRRAALAAATVATVALGAACGSSDDSSSKAKTAGAVSSAPITIRAGVNDPTRNQIAVLQYMPAKATVAVGQKVRWTWDETKEPHSVTFLAPGQTAPDPGSDTSLFAPTPPTGPYDGSVLVNSGLLPLGPQAVPPFEMTFSKPGSYNYICVIHPQMVGTIVVAAGDAGETAAAVTTRGDQEKGQWLAEGNEAYEKLMAAKPVSTRNRDGSTTWKVEMGTTTAHTDILAFAPVPAEVKRGDKVTFVNNSMAPHTASFFNQQPPITNPEDPAAQKAAPGPSPQRLNATDLFNTGLLPPNAPPGAGPPEAARSFTFSVPTAGDYQYICIYHAPSGMAGAIKAS